MMNNNSPSLEERVEMHRRMILTRRLEETLGDLHKAGKTRGPLHRCDGQEAVGIGATAMVMRIISARGLMFILFWLKF